MSVWNPMSPGPEKSWMHCSATRSISVSVRIPWVLRTLFSCIRCSGSRSFSLRPARTRCAVLRRSHRMISPIVPASRTLRIPRSAISWTGSVRRERFIRISGTLFCGADQQPRRERSGVGICRHDGQSSPQPDHHTEYAGADDHADHLSGHAERPAAGKRRREIPGLRDSREHPG